MRKGWLVGLALLLCLPMIGSGQSITYYPAGGLSELTSSGTAITSTLPLLFSADNTHDIGASGATRPKNIYTGNQIIVPPQDWNKPSIASNAYPTRLGLWFTGFNVVLSADNNGIAVGSTSVNPNAGNDLYSLGSATSAYKHQYLTRGTQGSKSLALTEGAATTVVTVAVPQTAGANFAAGEFRYTVYATDGTDTQVLNGSAFFSALNKAGTEACQLTDDQIGTEASSSGTLACTITCVVGLTDVVGLAMDCTSSLTQTTLTGMYRLEMQKTNTETPAT